VGRVRDQPVRDRGPDRPIEAELLDAHARGVALLLGLQVIATVDEQHERRHAERTRGRFAEKHAATGRTVEARQRVARIVVARQILGHVFVLRRDDERVELQRVECARQRGVRVGNGSLIRREAGKAVCQSIDHRRVVLSLLSARVPRRARCARMRRNRLAGGRRACRKGIGRAAWLAPAPARCAAAPARGCVTIRPCRPRVNFRHTKISARARQNLEQRGIEVKLKFWCH